MGSFSIWHWLIVLAVVILVFGTKKLGNVGSDLGKAVRGFKEGIKSGEDSAGNGSKASSQVADQSTIDDEAKEKTKS